MTSRIEAEPGLQLAESVVTDVSTADGELQQENWYFWSKRTATRRQYYGSESITTVYAVKAAIGQQRRKGWKIYFFAYSYTMVC